VHPLTTKASINPTMEATATGLITVK
jgi:hypothetical protein